MTSLSNIMGESSVKAMVGGGWLVEVLEPLAPWTGIKSLVLLACTHRQFNAILKEDSIWQASLRKCVDIPFDVVLKAEQGLTWRYLATHVLDGLGRLRCEGAEVLLAVSELFARALFAPSSSMRR